jgi:hypothetical protein
MLVQLLVLLGSDLGATAVLLGGATGVGPPQHAEHAGSTEVQLKNAAFTSLIVTITRPKSMSLSAAASLRLQVTSTWSA